MTAPHIGNTGVNDEDAGVRPDLGGRLRRARPGRRGRRPGGRRRSLDDELAAQGVVGISGVDTRALTRHLRERGRDAGRLHVSGHRRRPRCSSGCRPAPAMAGADLTARGDAPREPYVVPAVGEKRLTVAALDLGIKRMTPRRMAERGIETHVLPAGVDRRTQVLAAGPGRRVPVQRPGRPGHRRPRRSR